VPHFIKLLENTQPANESSVVCVAFADSQTLLHLPAELFE